jgi:hypothetical protein
MRHSPSPSSRQFYACYPRVFSFDRTIAVSVGETCQPLPDNRQVLVALPRMPLQTFLGFIVTLKIGMVKFSSTTNAAGQEPGALVEGMSSSRTNYTTLETYSCDDSPKWLHMRLKGDAFSLLVESFSFMDSQDRSTTTHTQHIHLDWKVFWMCADRTHPLSTPSITFIHFQVHVT